VRVGPGRRTPSLEVGDVTAIVDLVAADHLGATRDGVHTPEDLAAYEQASTPIPLTFRWSPRAGQDLAATMQLSFIPELAERVHRVLPQARPCSAGPSRKPAAAAAPVWSSPPTSHDLMPTVSTSGSAS